MTHVPRANLLYSPRNKILASGLLIEAFLYEEQTRRGLSLAHFDEMIDVADHCTVCHKCLTPCPVDIDYGEVTVNMRKVLVDRGKKPTNPGAWAAMQFLSSSDPRAIKIMRQGLGIWGFRTISMGHRVVKRLGLLGDRAALPAATSGRPKRSTQAIELVRRPMRVDLPKQAFRAALDLESQRYVALIRPPGQAVEPGDTVFYFPGCGSERLFSDIGLAALAMLWQAGAQTVLPPGYLCCGFPQTAAGLHQKGRRITAENRVLFHRVANTLSYLEIKTVIVSCGTCMDRLLEYQFEQIFPGCRLLDIHEYLLERGIRLQTEPKTHYLFHDPCHSPMKTHAPSKVTAGLLGKQTLTSDRCCGEAGTLGVTRPDIANQLRYRKSEELVRGIEQLIGQQEATADNVKLLTSCPACQQGLAKFQDETGLETDYLVTEMARQLLGEDWQRSFIRQAKQGGIERVLM